MFHHLYRYLLLEYFHNMKRFVIFLRSKALIN